MTYTRQELATILEVLDEVQNRLDDRDVREPMVDTVVLAGSDGRMLGSVVLDLSDKDVGSYRFKVGA